jgi:hypothetical protein
LPALEVDPTLLLEYRPILELGAGTAVPQGRCGILQLLRETFFEPTDLLG